jgi:hypothetical protein
MALVRFILQKSYENTLSTRGMEQFAVEIQEAVSGAECGQWNSSRSWRRRWKLLLPRHIGSARDPYFSSLIFFC